MLEYIKIFLLAIFTGSLLPLPTSAAAHYSYLNFALDFSDTAESLGFYYSLMTMSFSLVIIILYRKEYISSFKALINRESQQKSRRKNLAAGTLISLIFVVVMSLPVFSGKMLLSYFDEFLQGNGLLVSALSGIVSGLLLVIAIWYNKKSTARKIGEISVRSLLRFSVYQCFSYVIPGLSHISAGCTNLLISDLDSSRVTGGVYTYLAPQMLMVSVVKIISGIVSGKAAVNVFSVIIALAVSATAAFLVIKLTKRVNMSRILLFFSIYSIAISFFIAIASFII